MLFISISLHTSFSTIFKNKINYLKEEIKHTKKDKRKKEKREDDIKIKILIFYFIFSFIIIYVLLITFHIHLAIAIILLFAFIKVKNKKLNEMNLDDKFYYICVILFTFSTFSNSGLYFYFKVFSTAPKQIFEYLLLIFLNLKIISSVFCIFTSILITFSNISSLFKNTIFIKKNLYLDYLKSEFKPYTLEFCLKQRLVIFTVLCPFVIILETIRFFAYEIKKMYIRFIFWITKKTKRFHFNSSKTIKRLLKVSAIISLIFVYGLSLVFSEQTRTLYEQISTVILIPLIYDSIKKKETKN